MKKTERENMLLFSKERVSGLYRYRLYFTPLSSLREDTPRVFRLLVRTPFSFNKFEIGRVYTLGYNKLHILSYQPKEVFNLQETDFLKLMQTRDLKFMDKKTSAALRSTDEPHIQKDRYYTFEEMREIINFRQDFLTSVAVGAFSAAMTAAALLVPFVIYAAALFLIFQGAAALEGFSAGVLALPIIGIGALPATLFLMSLFFSLCELALLRIDFTKWHLLKKYTLAFGGIRRSFFLGQSDIRYLKKFGLISAIALVVCIILAVIV